MTGTPWKLEVIIIIEFLFLNIIIIFSRPRAKTNLTTFFKSEASNLKPGLKGARSRGPLILRAHLYPQNIFFNASNKAFNKKKLFK